MSGTCEFTYSVNQTTKPQLKSMLRCFLETLILVYSCAQIVPTTFTLISLLIGERNLIPELYPASH